MRLIIDIPEERYKDIQRIASVQADRNHFQTAEQIIANGTPIADNATSGKEALIKYCLEHSGEEVYGFLRQLFDDSMSYTDSRAFVIDWLNHGYSVGK